VLVASEIIVIQPKQVTPSGGLFTEGSPSAALGLAGWGFITSYSLKIMTPSTFVVTRNVSSGYRESFVLFDLFTSAISRHNREAIVRVMKAPGVISADE